MDGRRRDGDVNLATPWGGVRDRIGRIGIPPANRDRRGSVEAEAMFLGIRETRCLAFDLVR